MLACCISACKNGQKSTADIICGGSYRYWYEHNTGGLSRCVMKKN